MTAKVLKLIPRDIEAGKPYTLEEREAEAERFVREAMAKDREEFAVRVAHELGITEGAARSIARGNYEQTLAVKAVRKMMAQSRPPGIVISGTVGTGKTFAAAVAWMNRQPDQAAYFVKSSNLRPAINRWMGDPDGQLINLGAHLVVLDDLGTERLDEHWTTAFQLFMDARVGATKTIITTNLTKQQLSERYDARTFDRLQTFPPIFVKGESMRTKEGW